MDLNACVCVDQYWIASSSVICVQETLSWASVMYTMATFSWFVSGLLFVLVCDIEYLTGWLHVKESHNLLTSY